MPNVLAINGGSRVVPEGLTRLWPQITENERQAVLRVLDSRILSGSHAPEIRALETEFAQYAEAKHCLSSNSGTAALHMAVAAAGTQPGDEVITSAFTFLASALAVLHHNAIPIFADIDPVTFNISPAEIERKITPRTRAVMPVHIHGLPADLDEIRAIARKHNLVVIEDAAQAHGATYKGRKVGAIGDMGAFSVQSSKNLPAGEGGLFVTNNDAFYERANCVRQFGEEAADSTPAGLDPMHPLDDLRDYNAVTMGWMYRMTSLTAAIARCQLARLDHSNENARRNAEYLTSRLSGLDLVTPPSVPADRTSVFHKYRVRLHPERLEAGLDAKRFRNALIQSLRQEGVETVLWQVTPVPSQVLFEQQAGYGKGCPWTCHKSTVQYRKEEYPETTRLLDNSLVIGSQSAPLAGQGIQLMHCYADAFEKVLADRDTLIRLARV
ncbi:MAG TPA: DegT/DnrJ/EryC1/StrS family aminotransferase [Bryobacteraceae bacterium]|nr:DegT/DnrJ/EryC1/StrS family aminotransferase [Bryobacteraceae bacterium]